MSARPRPRGKSRTVVEWNSQDGCSMVVQYLTADDAREVAYALGSQTHEARDLFALADRCDVANGEKVGP